VTGAPDAVADLVGGTPAADQAVGTLTVDVSADGWIAALSRARDAGYDYFDWLTVVDDDNVDEDSGAFVVVLHLYCLAQRRGLLMRTRVARDVGRLDSATAVFAGANWHEREALEMFGVTFDGHPDPRPLLLPDHFTGHPLRKEFTLAARAGQSWPGAVEDPSKAGSRRRVEPPGASGPGSWPEP
jgi:NADH-quinone oxidoreductase subunit C